MRIKFTKSDGLFLAALLAGTALYLVLSVSYPFLHDEYFYPTIPFRLLQGDSLFQHEWHLSQLSSLFTFLPVWAWMGITGSADGLLMFLRFVYLVVYAGVAIAVYRYFRRYGAWAVTATILFFTQTPYRILSLNYNSVYAICTLLLALCLLTLSQSPSPRTSFKAGLCVGCCCVCNPMFAGVYLGYLLLCALRRGSGNHLLSRETAVSSFAGVCLVGFVTLAFFFLTGGTVGSALRSLPLLLGSSEYLLGGKGLLLKLELTYIAYRNISLGMPWLLPLLYFAMLADAKRHDPLHRCLYLSLSLILGGIFIGEILKTVIVDDLLPQSMMFSLPLLIFTTTCYILTQTRNRRLFCWMWVPCAVMACVHYLAANTMLTALGFVMAAANVAGVLFVRDLWKEMAQTSSIPRFAGRSLICAGLCLQMCFQLFVASFGQISSYNTVRISNGPCAGMYVSTFSNSSYCGYIHDLDRIRSESPEDAPVLIVSRSAWMYLYADRPIATYTTWFEGLFQQEQLVSYYRHNPDKIPRYIYIESYYWHTSTENVAILSDLFDFTVEELSQGVLLTVESCKFS